MLVTLKTDVPLSFGGTEQPGAYGELLSIGAIGGAKNKALSKAISGILEAKLGVPPNRFYLSVWQNDQPFLIFVLASLCNVLQCGKHLRRVLCMIRVAHAHQWLRSIDQVQIHKQNGFVFWMQGFLVIHTWVHAAYGQQASHMHLYLSQLHIGGHRPYVLRANSKAWSLKSIRESNGMADTAA